MQLATLDRLGIWVVGSECFLRGPFTRDCGVACWRCLTQVLLWHMWRGGGPLSLGSLKTGPGSHHLPPPALSKERALCSEQDLPSDVPEACVIAR